MAKTEHNKGKSGEYKVGYKKPPRNPSSAFKPGQSGNPSGRPPNEKSITFWLREFSGMTSKEAAKLCVSWAKELNAVNSDLPMAALVALRSIMSLVSEPTPGLLGHALDRVDGTLEQKLKTDGANTQTIEVVYVNHQDRTRSDA